MKLTYKYVSLSGIDQFFTECWYVFYFREKSYENNFSRFYSLMNFFFLTMYFPNYVFFLKNISKVRYYVRVCVKQLRLAFQYLVHYYSSTQVANGNTKNQGQWRNSHVVMVTS